MCGIGALEKYSASPSNANDRDRLESASTEEGRRKTLGHEISNPLMAISGLAEMVLQKEPGLSETSVQRLKEILVQCDRIAALLPRSRERGGEQGGTGSPAGGKP